MMQTYYDVTHTHIRVIYAVSVHTLHLSSCYLQCYFATLRSRHYLHFYSMDISVVVATLMSSRYELLHVNTLTYCSTVLAPLRFFFYLVLLVVSQHTP